MNVLERFKYYFPSQIIKDNKTGQRYYGNKSLVDLLNELHETIQVLERYLDNMRCGALTDDKKIKELYDENKRLKKDIEYYKTERLVLFEYLDKKDDLKLKLKVKK